MTRSPLSDALYDMRVRAQRGLNASRAGLASELTERAAQLPYLLADRCAQTCASPAQADLRICRALARDVERATLQQARDYQHAVDRALQAACAQLAPLAATIDLISPYEHSAVSMARDLRQLTARCAARCDPAATSPEALLGAQRIAVVVGLNAFQSALVRCGSALREAPVEAPPASWVAVLMPHAPSALRDALDDHCLCAFDALWCILDNHFPSHTL